MQKRRTNIQEETYTNSKRGLLAGCSLYGVADLSALAGDTHKFESRYLDSLVGRWPEDEAISKERAPINSGTLLAQ